MLTILWILFIVIALSDIILTNKILSKDEIELNSEMSGVMGWLDEKWHVPKLISTVIAIGCTYTLKYIGYPNAALTFIICADLIYVCLVWHNWKESKKTGNRIYKLMEAQND